MTLLEALIFVLKVILTCASVLAAGTGIILLMSILPPTVGIIFGVVGIIIVLTIIVYGLNNSPDDPYI